MALSVTNVKSKIRSAKVYRGFTLVEVLIVIAIVGILASIAYPQYGSYVQKARRTDGQLALLQGAQTMERCKSTRYTFALCTLNDAESPEAYYAMTVASDATTFTLTATAQNLQVADTTFKIMTLKHKGERTPDPDTTVCWPN